MCGPAGVDERRGGVRNLDVERLRRLRLGGRAASRRRLVSIGRAQAQHLPNRRDPVSANPPSRNPCLAGRLTLLPGELRRELHAFHCTQRGRREPTIMVRPSITTRTGRRGHGRQRAASRPRGGPGGASGFDAARSADAHVESLQVMLAARGASVLDVTHEERLLAEVFLRDISPVAGVGAGFWLHPENLHSEMEIGAHDLRECGSRSPA